MTRLCVPWLLLVACLLGGCSDNINGEVYGSKSFSSKWKIKKQGGLVAGTPETSELELKVDGGKFAGHRSTTMVTVGMAGEIRETVECDIVYDGKTVYVFNQKAKINDEPFTKIDGYQQFTPEEKFEGAFWRFTPKADVTEKGSEDLGGTKFTVFEGRAGTALGTDAVYKYLVDTGKGYVRQYQTGYSEGSGTKMSKVEKQYDCVEFSASPTFTGSEFKYTPEGTASDVTSFEF